MKVRVAVRDVEEEVWLRLKSLAVLKKMKLGDALTEAMREWIEKHGSG